MFEAYSVGVSLRLHNFVTPALLQIGQEFKGVQVLSDALRASMKATELQAKSLAAALRSVNAATPGSRSAAAKAADDTASAFDKATQAAQRYKTTMQGASMAAPHAGAIHPTSPLFAHAVAAQQSAIAATMGSSLATQMAIAQRMSSMAMTHHLPGLLAQQAVMAGGGGPPYGPYMAAPRLAGPAGMPYTPFRMRTPGGVGGAGGGGGGAGGAGPHLVPPGGGMMPMMAPMGAMLPLAGVAAAVYGGKALYESARDYETAMARYKTLNLGDKANTEADLFARRTQVKGVSSTQLIETLRESVGIFGSMGDAMKVSPMVAQLNAANSNLFGGKIGAIDSGAARAIFRFNDIRGLTNSPEGFAKGLDVAQRLVTGSGGAIQFKDLEQFAKRGGVAFRSLSDEGMLMYATVLQEKGGNAAGTGMMSMYQNLVAGRITKKAMAALEASGLATLGTVDTGTVGGKKSKSTVIKSLVDMDMLRENQGGWIIKNGIPAAMRLGDRTDSQIAARINSWLSNRTGADNAVSFGVQHLQALRDRNMTANAAGYGQTIALQGQTLAGKQGEFMAAWSNFKTEFGLGALPAFSKVLTGGSTLLREINIALESSGAKSLIAIYEKGFKFQSDGVESLVRTYRDGFSKQWDMLGKAGNFLFGDKQTTGSPVAGKDTDAGAFTGYRSPIRTSAGGGRGFINNTIVLPDGRVLANVVTQEQAKDLRRPPTGPRTADGRQSIRAFDSNTGG